MIAWIVAAVFFLSLWLLLMLPAFPKRGCAAFYGKKHFAHRGLHDENVCENSMQAFRMAVQAGYGIELDVHLTKDGQLCVFHDDTLKRLCGREEAVREMTMDELQKILLPDGQMIPSFEEVLELIQGQVPLIVEIKSPEIGNCAVSERLWQCLKDYRGDYLVQSFDPFQLRWFKKHAPRVIRGQLAQKGRFKGPFRLRHIPGLMAGNLLINRISAPDYIAYRQEDTKKCCYRMMRRVYRPGLAVWTVRSETEEKKMQGLCDAIIFENFHPQIKGGKNHE